MGRLEFAEVLEDVVEGPGINGLDEEARRTRLAKIEEALLVPVERRENPRGMDVFVRREIVRELVTAIYRGYDDVSYSTVYSYDDYSLLFEGEDTNPVVILNPDDSKFRTESGGILTSKIVPANHTKLVGQSDSVEDIDTKFIWVKYPRDPQGALNDLLDYVDDDFDGDLLTQAAGHLDGHTLNYRLIYETLMEIAVRNVAKQKQDELVDRLVESVLMVRMYRGAQVHYDESFKLMVELPEGLDFNISLICGGDYWTNQDYFLLIRRAWHNRVMKRVAFELKNKFIFKDAETDEPIVPLSYDLDGVPYHDSFYVSLGGIRHSGSGYKVYSPEEA